MITKLLKGLLPDTFYTRATAEKKTWAVKSDNTGNLYHEGPHGMRLPVESEQTKTLDV